MTALSNISVGRFKGILASGDIERIRTVAESIRWRHPHDNDPIYPLLYDLWKGKSLDSADAEPGIFNDPLIRIYFAYSLLQGWDGRFVELDAKDIVEFVRDNLTSDDFEVKDTAIAALGFVDAKPVVQELYDIAALEEPETFRRSALVLLRKCSPEATDAVARLMASVRNEKYRTFIREAKANWDASNRNPRLCPRVCADCDL